MMKDINFQLQKIMMGILVVLACLLLMLAAYGFQKRSLSPKQGKQLFERMAGYPFPSNLECLAVKRRVLDYDLVLICRSKEPTGWEGNVVPEALPSIVANIEKQLGKKLLNPHNPNYLQCSTGSIDLIQMVKCDDGYYAYVPLKMQ